MINKGLFSSNTPEWSTPQKLFDELDAEFQFTLDPCSTHDNAKCEKHYTIENDGLSKSWGGKEFFVTLLMVKNFLNGLKNAMMKLKKVLLWSCSFLPGQMPLGFMITSMARLK